MITCEHCQASVDETDRRALTTHYWTHRIGGPHLIVKHFHGGVPPVCACGCGEKTIYDKRKQAFGEYREGHNSWRRRLSEGEALDAPKPLREGSRGTPKVLNPVIYSITNSATGQQYVGLDSYWPSRRNYHLSLLERKQHYNRHLQGSFVKYGRGAFVFTILERLERVEDLGVREQHWIATLDTFKNGYNMSVGGEGTQSHLTRNERRRAAALLNPVEKKPDGRKVAPAEERVVKQTQAESYDEKGVPSCVACKQTFTDQKDLVWHFWKKHRVNAMATILHFYHGGVVPVCECGCHELVRYSPHNHCYNPFVNGHNAKGSLKSRETRARMSAAMTGIKRKKAQL